MEEFTIDFEGQTLVVACEYETPYREGFYTYGGWSVHSVISVDGVAVDDFELSERDEQNIIEELQEDDVYIMGELAAENRGL